MVVSAAARGAKQVGAGRHLESMSKLASASVKCIDCVRLGTGRQEGSVSRGSIPGGAV